MTTREIINKLEILSEQSKFKDGTEVQMVDCVPIVKFNLIDGVVYISDANI